MYVIIQPYIPVSSNKISHVVQTRCSSYHFAIPTTSPDGMNSSRRPSLKVINFSCSSVNPSNLVREEQHPRRRRVRCPVEGLCRGGEGEGESR